MRLYRCGSMTEPQLRYRDSRRVDPADVVAFKDSEGSAADELSIVGCLSHKPQPDKALAMRRWDGSCRKSFRWGAGEVYGTAQKEDTKLYEQS
jgi:hypothetical protein